MNQSLSKIASATVALALLGATAVQAAPLTVASQSAVGFEKGSAGISADQVQYRRRYYGRRYYNGYNAGPAIAAGAALGLLGAGIAAAGAAPYGYGYGYPAYGYGYPGYYGY